MYNEPMVRNYHEAQRVGEVHNFFIYWSYEGLLMASLSIICFLGCFEVYYKIVNKVAIPVYYLS